MVKKFSVSFLSLILLFLFTVRSTAGEFEDKVKNVGVTVKVPGGSGSGCLFLSKGHVYCLTAGHVVCHCRKDTEVNIFGPIRINRVDWDQPIVERVLFHKGRQVGILSSRAKVLKFSAHEENGGLDIALLQLENDNFSKTGARFLTDNSIIGEGLDIVHVGSLYGELTNSVCYGKVVRPDFHVFDTSFTVCQIGGRPGSSGGPVFTKIEDKYLFIGMLTRGDNGGLNLIKPSWVIEAWLHEEEMDDIVNSAR